MIGFVKDRTSLVSLKHKFTVKDCHNKGVTAIAVISRGDRVVSGGGEGQVTSHHPMYTVSLLLAVMLRQVVWSRE